MKIYSFENLLIWQKSIKLNVMIYQFTKTFPKEEMFGLITQIRRSSVSISSKIAEISLSKFFDDVANVVKGETNIESASLAATPIRTSP